MSDSPLAVTGLCVFVRDLIVEAEIGLYGHEKGRRQPLRVDVEAWLEPTLVHGLADTVNYERLARAAREIAEGGHIDLVESYAQRLAAACLVHPVVRRVKVRIDKPGALEDAVAGVELTAERTA